MPGCVRRCSVDCTVYPQLAVEAHIVNVDGCLHCGQSRLYVVERLYCGFNHAIYIWVASRRLLRHRRVGGEPACGREPRYIGRGAYVHGNDCRQSAWRAVWQSDRQHSFMALHIHVCSGLGRDNAAGAVAYGAPHGTVASHQYKRPVPIP